MSRLNSTLPAHVLQTNEPVLMNDWTDSCLLCVLEDQTTKTRFTYKGTKDSMGVASPESLAALDYRWVFLGMTQYACHRHKGPLTDDPQNTKFFDWV